MKSFALAALAGLAAADASNHWAVIMAGSNTYSNYRHQSDTHHAVKIMLENGIPRSNIIHLAYDDIANNRMNPFPGALYNKPATGAGVNVYDQSEIDYSGRAVNKSNFLSVLTGDATKATGPVLQSDHDSHVFVYFADHGGAGLICTPNGSSDWIYADELDSALQTMKDKNMFKQLTFYLEACESGSMFPNLNADENIYAVTASNGSLSSWAAYCGSDATVNGTNIGSCLGDLFSINWMEDTDAAIAAGTVNTETLNTQFNTVVTKTTASPVQKFGNFTFMDEVIGEFQGVCDDDNRPTMAQRLTAQATHLYKTYTEEQTASSQMVDSRDNNLHFHYNRVLNENSEEAYAALQAEIEHRQFVDKVFETHFPAMANAPESPQDFDCLRILVGEYEELCGTWSDYSLKYVRRLANACDTWTAQDIAGAFAGLYDTCQ